MKKLLTLIAIIIALVVPASANANEPVDGLFGQAAMTYWGQYPSACGYITVYHWTPNGEAGKAEIEGGCKIWINAAAFSSWPAGRACMIYIHEWRHLQQLGWGYYAHSDDPTNVMYYATYPWQNIPYVRYPCSW